MTCRNLDVAVVCLALAAIAVAPVHAQSDPGPRPGPAAAGSFYSTLNANEQAFFNQAQLRFQEIDSVSGGIAGETGSGLGPTSTGTAVRSATLSPQLGVPVLAFSVPRMRFRIRR